METLIWKVRNSTLVYINMRHVPISNGQNHAKRGNNLFTENVISDLLYHLLHPIVHF